MERNEKFYISNFSWLLVPKITAVALSGEPILLQLLHQNHPVYCVFSTSGDVQYIGGCSVHRGCSVHWGKIMSTSGGYHEYTGGVQYIGGIS